MEYIRVISNSKTYLFPFALTKIMDDLKGQNWERVQMDETKGILVLLVKQVYIGIVEGKKKTTLFSDN